MQSTIFACLVEIFSLYFINSYSCTYFDSAAKYNFLTTQAIFFSKFYPLALNTVFDTEQGCNKSLMNEWVNVLLGTLAFKIFSTDICKSFTETPTKELIYLL